MFDVLTGRDSSKALIMFSESKLSCVNSGLPKAVRASTLTAQLGLENECQLSSVSTHTHSRSRHGLAL